MPLKVGVMGMGYYERIKEGLFKLCRDFRLLVRFPEMDFPVAKGILAHDDLETFVGEIVIQANFF